MINRVIDNDSNASILVLLSKQLMLSHSFNLMVHSHDDERIGRTGKPPIIPTWESLWLFQDIRRASFVVKSF